MTMDKNNDYICLDDFRKVTEKTLDKRIAGCLYGAANDGVTYEDNTEAFKRYKFRPKLLRDVSVRHLGTTLLGEHVDLPIGISPFSLANLFHASGELGLVRASEKMKTCYIQSHWSSRSVEEVSLGSRSCLKWIQVFVYRNRQITSQLIQRAKKLGYKAVVLTIDTPVSGRRLSDMKNEFNYYDLGIEGPYEERIAKTYSKNDEDAFKVKDLTMTWKDIQWIKQQTSLPVVVKGIITDFDARQAVNHGADAIMVSNHGGRQLDGVPATIDVLKEVVDEVGGACEIYLDGGIRMGTDVLKALALGARAVFIARPAAWGLTCGGEEGVCRVIEMLKEELDCAMALCGQTSVQKVDRDLVVHQNFRSSKI